jgi:hypothetical protein
MYPYCAAILCTILCTTTYMHNIQQHMYNMYMYNIHVHVHVNIQHVNMTCTCHMCMLLSHI